MVLGGECLRRLEAERSRSEKPVELGVERRGGWLQDCSAPQIRVGIAET